MGIIYANLSCDMPRDPRMLAAGWQARAVYVEAVLYCRENLTDGVIDRIALVCWMPDMPAKQKVQMLDRLVTVGALDTCDLGWKWPDKVWQAWNPSKHEVQTKREAEAKRKADYRAKKNGVPKASENVPMGQRVTALSCPVQEEEEPKEEPKPEGKGKKEPLISQNGSSKATPEQARGENLSSRQQDVIGHYVRLGVQGMEARGEQVKSDAGIRRHFTEQAANDEALPRWLDMFPTAPPDAVAAWLHGDKGSMRYYPRADEIAAAQDGPEDADIIAFPNREATA